MAAFMWSLGVLSLSHSYQIRPSTDGKVGGEEEQERCLVGIL